MSISPEKLHSMLNLVRDELRQCLDDPGYATVEKYIEGSSQELFGMQIKLEREFGLEVEK